MEPSRRQINLPRRNWGTPLVLFSQGRKGSSSWSPSSPAKNSWKRPQDGLNRGGRKCSISENIPSPVVILTWSLDEFAAHIFVLARALNTVSLEMKSLFLHGSQRLCSYISPQWRIWRSDLTLDKAKIHIKTKIQGEGKADSDWIEVGFISTLLMWTVLDSYTITEQIGAWQLFHNLQGWLLLPLGYSADR